MFARVALDHFTDKEFDYRIPSALGDRIVPGTRVEVPFGSFRKRGTVVSLQTHSAVAETRIKEILSVPSEITFLDSQMMTLLQWIHRYYGGSMGKVMRSAVPAAVRLSKVKAASVEWIEGNAAITPSHARSRKDTLVMHRLAQGNGRMRLAEILDDGEIKRPVIRRLEKKGWIRVVKETVIRGLDPNAPIVFSAPKPVLNDEQRHVVDVLTQRLATGFHGALLHGVTGSGKTEVYLRVIEQVLKQGRTALVLVPEISLTPQVLDRFRSRFKEPLAVLHSGLTEGQRYDQWRLIRRGGAKIVIGARSAVFAPLSNLGVIIVDEEQERSFKQQEAPHYNARDVAVMRAKLENILVVLGSATPSLETYHNVSGGKYELLELSARVDQRAMPRIEIHDMKKEHSKTDKIPLFSERLMALIHARLDRKEQIMLFLNRRGYHRCLWCPTCGEALQCPFCSVTMTHHRVGTKLMCHLCGHTREIPLRCPRCAGDLLIPQGYGTQKIEGMLRKWFPKARVARMDADTTRGKGSHRDILSRFALGQFDILVGTQMIAKGHDFPNVTLVGVLHADLGLNIPDFRAAENAFHLLTQVSGRAGRGKTGGEAIIQTFVPNHFLMAAVKSGDYKQLYERELALRKELHYPPTVHLILITVKHTSEPKAQEVARLLQHTMRVALKETAAVLQPSEAPLQKAKGLYRWQILLKTHGVIKTQEKIRTIIEEGKLPTGIIVDIDVDPL